MTDVTGIVERLRELSDELGDKAIDVLTEAVHNGETIRPAAERTLTQAKRAVDKAVSLLENL